MFRPTTTTWQHRLSRPTIMFSSSCRRAILSRQAASAPLRWSRTSGARSAPIIARAFSAPPSSDHDGVDDPALLENLQWSPPPVLTADMAHGIAEATHFYIRHGLSNRRLQALSRQTDLPVVEQWQKMMEIFLTTQVHVLAGMGYGASEQGLTQYAQDLAACLSEADDETSEELRDVRRETWRELVSACFDLELDEIPTLSIVDARNLMHKVSSKMVEPNILEEIQAKTSQISDPDPEVEVALKHNQLQQIIVNHVYLGGTPSIAEEAGFGTGRSAYAKLQCAMSDHEGDPLIAQYAASAMMRIWQAAGLDMNHLQGAMGGDA